MLKQLFGLRFFLSSNWRAERQFIRPFCNAIGNSSTCNSGNIKLRDYQQDAIDACVNSIDSGVKRIGVSLATGGGKTVIFANLIRQLRERKLNSGSNSPSVFRSLVLVHRRELALQSAQVFKKAFGEEYVNVQIEMGKHNCRVDDADVIIGSVQSLRTRLDKYKTDDIDLIIIDEAHHAVAKSYISILNHFRADTQNSKIPVIGFSATFERADNKALSQVMDKIVYEKGILNMIEENWLCEGRFTTVNANFQLAAVETSRSSNDFKPEQLSKVINTDEINNVVMQTYIQKRDQCNVKSALLFAVDVEHVKKLHELFESNGINSNYVTGTTKSSQRDEIVNEFKQGKIEVLINCGIFTEGTDFPNVDCILLCRPTKSRSLMVQMIGRGLRLHHSKKHCQIVDFVGASNVGVVSVPTLAGLDDFTEPLDDVTLDKLREIKENQKLWERQKNAEEAKFLEDKRRAYEKMMEKVSAFDLTLTSYQDFKSFCETQDSANDTKSLTNKESDFFYKSQYPWVKLAKDTWALQLYNNAHIRVYKEVNKNEIDGNKTEVKYLFKLYNDISRMSTGSAIRYVPHTVKKTSNLLEIGAKVEQVIQQLQNNKLNSDLVPRNFTKYSSWRKTLATDKQKSLIKKKLQAVNEKDTTNPVDNACIAKYLTHLRKGEASGILFATSMAKIYPLKSLLQVIKYKYKRNNY